jgi:hypothetical protein
MRGSGAKEMHGGHSLFLPAILTQVDGQTPALYYNSTLTYTWHRIGVTERRVSIRQPSLENTYTWR